MSQPSNELVARGADATLDLRDRDEPAGAEITKQQRDRRLAGQLRRLRPVFGDPGQIHVGDEVVGIGALKDQYLDCIVSLGVLNQRDEIADELGSQEVHRRCGDLHEQDALGPASVQRLEIGHRRPSRWGKHGERGAGGGPEDEVSTEVLPQRLDVVLPDRLVHAEQREDDVTAGPDRRAERKSKPHFRPSPRPDEEPVCAPGGEAVSPVRDVVEGAREARRNLIREHSLEQLLGHQRRRRSIVPAREAFGGLPAQGRRHRRRRGGKRDRATRPS